MKYSKNRKLNAPTWEWPLPPSPALPIEDLIRNALDAGRDSRPGRKQRADGWTQNRIQTFLVALATHGRASDAARTAGINPKNAYALRKRDRGGAFDRAWQAAVALARANLLGEFWTTVTWNPDGWRNRLLPGWVADLFSRRAFPPNVLRIK